MARQNQSTDNSDKKLHGVRDHLASIPAGRRSKWVVLVGFLILVAIVAPLAGRLSSVEENSNGAFLPDNAESLDVALLQDDFQRGDKSPAVIVYHRDAGLTKSDLAQVDADRQALDNMFSNVQAGQVVRSEDGKAALFAIPLAADDVVDDVDRIRDIVHSGDGLEVKVTGPAGLLTDLVSVFQGLDLTLLLATASVVTVLLLLIYRSPFLWLVPLIAVAIANFIATAAVYLLAQEDYLTVNGQSGGILPILVFGVGTDYALLLISRYREELRRHTDKHLAMAFALRRVAPAIIASAATVALGLLCLLASDLNSYQSLGVVGALGIVAALISMTLMLPALLVVLGRRAFWPFVPYAGDGVQEGVGLWNRLGGWISGRAARPVWIVTALTLAVVAAGVVNLDTNLAPADQFQAEPEAIAGQKLIAESFAAGSSAPNTVIANTSQAQAVQEAIATTQGVADVQVAGELHNLTSFSVTLTAEPGTEPAFDVIENLRDQVHAVPDANAIVGGPDAEARDVASANSRDLRVIIPLVLVVVTLVLGVLLRAIVAPLMLIATVLLSYGAALGTGVFVFDRFFDFAAVEPTVPLLSFVFLVALGVDYNIFLMSRIHEEAAEIGTHQGVRKGLATTGGVITSAGLVLAATFTVLSVLPLVSMAELGFVIAFGVLLDTLIVRSILVPALAFDLDRRVWWPSRLSKAEAVSSKRSPSELESREVTTM